MKNKIPSEGLRLGRDSGSILCDTLKKVAFSDSLGGGKTKIAIQPEMVSIPQIPDNASVASITFRNKYKGWKSYRLEIKIRS